VKQLNIKNTENRKREGEKDREKKEKRTTKTNISGDNLSQSL